MYFSTDKCKEGKQPLKLYFWIVASRHWSLLLREDYLFAVLLEQAPDPGGHQPLWLWSWVQGVILLSWSLFHSRLGRLLGVFIFDDELQPWLEHLKLLLDAPFS